MFANFQDWTASASISKSGLRRCRTFFVQPQPQATPGHPISTRILRVSYCVPSRRVQQHVFSESAGVSLNHYQINPTAINPFCIPKVTLSHLGLSFTLPLKWTSGAIWLIPGNGTSTWPILSSPASLACQDHNMDGREAQNSKKVTSRPTTTQSALQSTPPLLCTMQKIFRRTLLAERQAERRLAKRKEKNVKTWLKNNNEQTAYMKKQESLLKKTARVWRREDYELGSLAPKRDVGALKASYGTFDPQISQGPILYRPDMEDKLAPWGGKYLNLRERDRVVLLEGHDKGKVGKISKIDRSRAEVTVEGLNMVCLCFPVSNSLPFLVIDLLNTNFHPPDWH